MSVSGPAPMADDALFTRAISGYRAAFMEHHRALPESHRNQLWTEYLSQFLLTASPANPASEGAHSAPNPGYLDFPNRADYLANLGKRSRQDTPRTILGSGQPLAKRRATVCLPGPLFPPPCTSPVLSNAVVRLSSPFPIPLHHPVRSPMDIGLTFDRIRIPR